MFNTNFNTNFQSSDTLLNPATNINPYHDQYFGQNDMTPYIQGMNPPIPGGGNASSSDTPYPIEPSLATPYLNPSPTSNNTNSYAEGGKVKKRKKGKKSQGMNPFPTLAEMIRQQGGEEDLILAHINPIEAQMLGVLANGGKINETTGLPQFGFLNKPWKATKSILGGAGGAILGNMILPGVGGILGGALGQGLQHTARGKDPFQGALKGAGIGAILPSAASAASGGLNMLGSSKLGTYLGNYGNTNAILPALGFGQQASSAGNMGAAGRMFAANSTGNALSNFNNRSKMSGVSAGDEGGEGGSFIDTLMGKTKNFLSEPANLLSAGVLASSLLNRPKEKTPEKLAEEQKRYQKALMLNNSELSQKEAASLAEEQMKRRIARNKFLPEERLGNVEPLYTRTNTPDEYRRTGKWLNYYNNPEFSGNPIMMKIGGSVHPRGLYEEEYEEYPSGLIEGIGGGQDDDIRMDVPENSYFVDASTVSDLGDGNTKAGAKKIQALVSNGEFFISPEKVTNLGKGNNEMGVKLLDKMVKNVRKHKGGKVNLPPKAKSLASYIRG
jgi:hypothetical protein